MNETRPELQELLSAYIDGKAAPSEIQEIEAWIAQSPEAAARLAFLQSLKNASNPARIATPSALSARIAAATYERPSLLARLTRWLQPAPVRLSLGGLMATALVVGIVVPRVTPTQSITLTQPTRPVAATPIAATPAPTASQPIVSVSPAPTKIALAPMFAPVAKSEPQLPEVSKAPLRLAIIKTVEPAANNINNSKPKAVAINAMDSVKNTSPIGMTAQRSPAVLNTQTQLAPETRLASASAASHSVSIESNAPSIESSAPTRSRQVASAATLTEIGDGMDESEAAMGENLPDGKFSIGSFRDRKEEKNTNRGGGLSGKKSDVPRSNDKSGNPFVSAPTN
jgi:anti-sigma factor RsiW